MKMKLERSMVETAEYRPFCRRYPHLAETIRLERKIERLEKKLKSEKRSSLRLQIKRETNVTKAKLRKERILKRIHGESKQEAIFRRRAGINTLKSRITRTLQEFSAHARRVIHIDFPPSLHDLRSLEKAETGLALREWIQGRHRKRRKQKTLSL
ncbi:MAG: hypothetical protein JSV85_04345 [Candidatus Bathyarchaeota archaeon]|nr:MAG: hypothetical protein JSV85_04345 [Candidatus Bathyarchaeota archaeon]